MSYYYYRIFVLKTAVSSTHFRKHGQYSSEKSNIPRTNGGSPEDAHDRATVTCTLLFILHASYK
jgi:hypothetical protein